MKVPGNLSGDRLILEYLSRVTVAGTRYLPKGSRIAFVGSTRNRIEREIGPGGAADTARVREVLTRLGEPEDLVRAERARLDAERVGARGGDAGTAALTTPLEHRRINSRWKPATQARPRRPPGRDSQGGAPPQEPREAAEGRKRRSRLGGLLWDRPPDPAEPRPESPPAGAEPPVAGPPGQATGGQASGGRAPGGQASGGRAWSSTAGLRPWRPSQWDSDDAAGQAAGGAGSAASGAEGTADSGEAGTTESGGTGGRPASGISARALGSGGGEPAQQPAAGEAAPAPAADRPAGSVVPIGPVTPVDGTPIPPREPLTVRGLAITAGRGAARLAVTGAKLARRYPLESAAVVLLGVGGLFYPFPCWLLGGVLAVFSRIWNARDKWIAITGPPVIAVVGMLVTAMFMRGSMIGNIPHAFHLDFGYLLRLGSLLCAIYLALQARRGPQRRLPPWQRTSVIIRRE
jgi:hypothetical protein